ncbi:MAG: DUF5009 domain-containing protein [Thermoguttaceae bacterium]|nr:DUF5009 domain-containing protein [Thermoguttaceae bacterium]
MPRPTLPETAPSSTAFTQRSASNDLYPLADAAPPASRFASKASNASSPAPRSSASQCDRASQRLMSLDALRGLNMLFIVGLSAVIVEICNLWPGAVSDVLKTQMTHVEWNGLRHHDTIFPLFLFLAGASFPFSLAKSRENGLSTARITVKVIFRGLALVVLGIVYNNGVNFDFENLRYGSVLGHIGLGWMFAALLFMSMRRRLLIPLSALILVGYWLALALVPAPDVNPREAFTKEAFTERFQNILTPEKSASIQKNFTMEGSVVGYVDRTIMPGRLYKGVHDPEGLASTVPAIVTALLGMLFGSVLRSKSRNYLKVFVLLFFGAALTCVGWAWNEVLPINKNLWNSSFVCFVGGCSAIALGLFYLIIDVWGLRRWAFAFVVVGANPLAIYLGKKFFDLNHTRDFFFSDAITRFVPETYQPLATTFAGLLVAWLILLWLYRRRIFIKI